jgi:hypothetical protein
MRDNFLWEGDVRRHARENPKLDFGIYRTDRKGIGGRGRWKCWEYMDGKEWYASEQETRVIPILAFCAFNWHFSLWVVGSEAEYGACSPFFMDAAESRS